MAQPAIEFDRTQLGKQYDLGEIHVTREMIRQYAEAIGDTNPLFTDEEAARRAGHPSVQAPPTFPTVLVYPGMRPHIGLKHRGDYVLATWAMEPLAPIHAGDTISGTLTLKDVYAKTGRSGSMIFVAWELEFRNQHGELVATGRKSYITRPPGHGGEW